MNELELITTARGGLNRAETAWRHSVFNEYAEHMDAVLNLLIEELVSEPPAAEGIPAKGFNPERVLEDIAIAIKHRTISDTGRWKIIHYHTRITCVPDYVTTPEQIFIGALTDNMVDKGFSTIYWNQLKQNVIKLYREIHK